MAQHDYEIEHISKAGRGFELPDTIAEGARNDTLMRYASSLQAKGRDDDEIFNRVMDANRNRCVSPLCDAEVIRIVENVTSRYEKGPSEAYREVRAGRRDFETSSFDCLLTEGVNDRVLSRVFGDMYRSRLRWVCEASSWFTYDGTRWVDGSSGGKELAERLMKEFVERLCRWACSIEDPEKRTAVMKEAAKYNGESKRKHLLEDSHEALNAHIADFDTDKNLFNVKNGTLELRPDFTFRPHDPADMITKVAGCDYDPDAGYGEWLEFLGSTFEGREDVTPFLQQRMGLALAADTSLECFYIVVGATRTGKSTFCETVASVFGSYAGTADPATFYCCKRSGGSATPDYAAFRGARFITVPELPERMPLDIAFVKRLTGGDVIRARKLHQESFEFRAECASLINTNYLPTLSDNTLFTSDRIVVVPFRNKVPEAARDHGLKERMKEGRYKSGVLNWLLDGLKQYEAFRMDVPPTCRDEVAAYRENADVLGEFIEECCELDGGAKTKGHDIYARYSEWSKERGYGTLSERSFYDKLRDMNVTVKRGVPDAGRAQVRNCVFGLTVSPLA